MDVRRDECQLEEVYGRIGLAASGALLKRL